ncbi:MAG: hypothetical protein Kow00121_21300 [Elainellaceae cyanobacterium]
MTVTKRVFLLLNTAALLIGLGGMSAQAETLGSTAEEEAIATESAPLGTESIEVTTSDVELQSPNLVPGTSPAQANVEPPATTTDIAQEPIAQESSTQEEPVAQVLDDVSPGRATRSSPSYIGIGGNIGLGEGDTALGDSSFAVFSKIGLTNYLSVRPSILIEDDPTILLPLTVDFVPGVTDATEDVSGEIGLRVSPYVGAGIAISTSEEGAVDFLATGGVDVPISSRFTANASVNATLFDNAAVGLMLGVGYNF